MISNSICSAAKRQATCRYSYFRSIAWELHSLGCDCAIALGVGRLRDLGCWWLALMLHVPI